MTFIEALGSGYPFTYVGLGEYLVSSGDKIIVESTGKLWTPIVHQMLTSKWRVRKEVTVTYDQLSQAWDKTVYPASHHLSDPIADAFKALAKEIGL